MQHDDDIHLEGLTANLNTTKTILGNCSHDTNMTNYTNYTRPNHTVSVNNVSANLTHVISNHTGEKKLANITRADTNITVVCPGYNMSNATNSTATSNATSEVQLKSAVKT